MSKLPPPNGGFNRRARQRPALPPLTRLLHRFQAQGNACSLSQDARVAVLASDAHSVADEGEARNCVAMSTEDTVRDLAREAADDARGRTVVRPTVVQHAGHAGVHCVSASVNGNGRVAVSCGIDGVVRFWGTGYGGQDRSAGRVSGIREGRSVSLSLKNDALDFLVADGIGLSLWDVKTMTQTKLHSSAASSLICCSRVAEVAAACGGNGFAGVWDTRERDKGGACSIELDYHQSCVNAIAMSRDNFQMLATGGADGNVCLWDLRYYSHPRAVHEGHGVAVRSVAVSDCGEVFVSGGMDQRVIVWNVSQELRHQILLGHTKSVASCSVSGDGKTVLSIGSDGKVLLHATRAPADQIAGNPPPRSSKNPSLLSPGGAGPGKLFGSSGRIKAEASIAPGISGRTLVHDESISNARVSLSQAEDHCRKRLLATCQERASQAADVSEGAGLNNRPEKRSRLLPTAEVHNRLLPERRGLGNQDAAEASENRGEDGARDMTKQRVGNGPGGADGDSVKESLPSSPRSGGLSNSGDLSFCARAANAFSSAACGPAKVLTHARAVQVASSLVDLESWTWMEELAVDQGMAEHLFEKDQSNTHRVNQTLFLDALSAMLKVVEESRRREWCQAFVERADGKDGVVTLPQARQMVSSMMRGDQAIKKSLVKEKVRRVGGHGRRLSLQQFIEVMNELTCTTKGI